ncbi:bifunctional [glutamate--ammonia ligase]-adenylyl-L-tyrosine phosphorylase/[glutamate--ammonia-ligase] adenylyltransferase [Frateuria aurantia]
MSSLTSTAWPVELRSLVDDRYTQLMARCRDQGIPFHDDAGVAERVCATLLASDFAFDAWLRRPEWLSPQGMAWLAGEADIAARLAACVLPDDEAGCMAMLRKARQGEALRLVFRDVNGLDTVAETLGATSALYEGLTEVALEWSARALLPRFGVAGNAQGQPQRLVVMGLGKLGGNELNFSSDIDLILGYAHAGHSDGRQPLDNSEYFLRLSRQLVRLLSEPTIDGICARVDLRLRPYGQAGRTALSFEAMEHYYQHEGRDWERYAWIKARPVAGDRQAGRHLIDQLRPFVYRRYLDYTAFAGLREMKALIDREVARKDLKGNLKLGAGGIREIEFVVQLNQMIRGGREPTLRVQGLLPALASCEARGFITRRSARALREAYLFLRQLENRLQMLRDMQTHSIPGDALSRQRIALGMGYPDWDALEQTLNQHRERVSEEFAAALVPQGGAASPAPTAERGLWQRAVEAELSEEDAEAAGLGRTGASLLAHLAQSPQVRAMAPRGRELLDRLMPRLLLELRSCRSAAAVLDRLVRLIQAVARRASYLALLEEQPAARRRLLRLFERSAFLAEQVIAQPLLLDDVFDPRIDHLPLDSEAISAELNRVLDTLEEREAGVELERLNELKASLAFRIGLAFDDGRAGGTLSAYRLAAVAESIIRAVTALAARELKAQHGLLPGPGLGFAVLGYGSLGGMELGLASDLDLVFIYDAAQAAASSDGPRALVGVHWYLRMAQRIINWLGVLTRAGRLYEVDPRLRPDGAKGLLVVSVDAFASYQRDRAWTWEHQALVRARPVAGDPELCRRFIEIRQEVLTRPVDAGPVLAQVSQMRQRWRSERDRSRPGWRDLKQGRGTLIDIEFLLQALVLEHAARIPDLLSVTATADLITACAMHGLLTQAQRASLLDAHETLLNLALASTLDLRTRVAVDDASLQKLTAEVMQICRSAGLALDQASALPD